MNDLSSACARQAAHENALLLTRQRHRTFWAEHATERAVIAFLLEHNVSLQSIVDVGAGEYTYKRQTAADASSLEATFRDIGPAAHYYGFEPNVLDFRGLRRLAARSRVVPRGHAHLYNLALAGTNGSRPFFGEPHWVRNRNASDVDGPRWRPVWTAATSPNTHTTNAALEGLQSYRRIGTVRVTTLDHIAASEPTLCCARPLDFVKVDTEGTEAEVLFDGARKVLAAKRLRSALWEYSDKINADAVGSALHGPSSLRQACATLACHSVWRASRPRYRLLA